MPTENNPWSNELKAKRQKSRDSNKGKVTSNSNIVHDPPVNPVHDHGLTSSDSHTVDNTENMIKQTKKNLRPVPKTFKTTEDIIEDEEVVKKGSVSETSGVVEDGVKSSERKRRESEEYLMMNFPADVRKNLKGIILPEDEDKPCDPSDKNNDKEDNDEVKVVNNTDEGNLFQGQEKLTPALLV